MCMYIYTFINTCVCIYIHLSIHRCACVYIYTYTYTYVYIYICFTHRTNIQDLWHSRSSQYDTRERSDFQTINTHINIHVHMHLHIQPLLHLNIRTNTHRLHTAACGSAAPLAASRKRGRRRGTDAEDDLEGMPEEGGREQIRSRLWLASHPAGAYSFGTKKIDLLNLAEAGNVT